MSVRDPHYDRTGAAKILARLAEPGLFAAGIPLPDAPVRIGYTAVELTAEPSSRLTLSQRLYLERFMAPCRPDQVATATHRITWHDSDGIPNTGHYTENALGPMMPIAVRETVLTLWRALAADRKLAEAALDLSDADFDVLAATTTDREPIEIFRIGIEATGRALAQHALAADQVGYHDPAEFAVTMRDSSLFAAVAGTWYWELQASTFRRGMIPVRLHHDPEGRIRYTAETVAVLSAMKQRTIAEADETMRRAMDEEGLSAAQAVRKYHNDLDLISAQYALLDNGTQPRCLGAAAGLLPAVVAAFVDVFVELLGRIEIHIDSEQSVADSDSMTTADGEFHVPDMNCKHCRITIAAVLESHGAEAADIDLVTKKVVTQFKTRKQREEAFAAIRDSGYTVVVAGQKQGGTGTGE